MIFLRGFRPRGWKFLAGLRPLRHNHGRSRQASPFSGTESNGTITDGREGRHGNGIQPVVGSRQLKLLFVLSCHFPDQSKKKRSGLLIGNTELARLREILQALVGREAGLMAVAFVL